MTARNKNETSVLPADALLVDDEPELAASTVATRCVWDARGRMVVSGARWKPLMLSQAGLGTSFPQCRARPLAPAVGQARALVPHRPSAWHRVTKAVVPLLAAPDRRPPRLRARTPGASPSGPAASAG